MTITKQDLVPRNERGCRQSSASAATVACHDATSSVRDVNRTWSLRSDKLIRAAATFITAFSQTRRGRRVKRAYGQFASSGCSSDFRAEEYTAKLLRDCEGLAALVSAAREHGVWGLGVGVDAAAFGMNGLHAGVEVVAQLPEKIGACTPPWRYMARTWTGGSVSTEAEPRLGLTFFLARPPNTNKLSMRIEPLAPELLSDNEFAPTPHGHAHVEYLTWVADGPHEGAVANTGERQVLAFRVVAGEHDSKEAERPWSPSQVTGFFHGRQWISETRLSLPSYDLDQTTLELGSKVTLRGTLTNPMRSDGPLCAFRSEEPSSPATRLCLTFPSWMQDCLAPELFNALTGPYLRIRGTGCAMAQVYDGAGHPLAPWFYEPSESSAGKIVLSWTGKEKVEWNSDIAFSLIHVASNAETEATPLSGVATIDIVGLQRPARALDLAPYRYDIEMSLVRTRFKALIAAELVVKPALADNFELAWIEPGSNDPTGWTFIDKSTVGVVTVVDNFQALQTRDHFYYAHSLSSTRDNPVVLALIQRSDTNVEAWYCGYVFQQQENAPGSCQLQAVLRKFGAGWPCTQHVGPFMTLSASTLATSIAYFDSERHGANIEWRVTAKPSHPAPTPSEDLP